MIRRCPAFFRKCSKCGAIGHPAVKSHTKQVQEMVAVREEQETQVLEEEEQPRLFVGMVETEKVAQPWTVELETHGRQVCYKLDTGSQVNVLPRNVYDSLKSPPALMQTRVKLMSYGSSVVDGQCLCEVKYNGKGTFGLRFFVVPARSSPFMGLDACQTLGLVTGIDSVSARVNQLENDSVTKHYLSVFLGVGLPHNHVYTIGMKEGVVPYSVSAPRRVKIPYFRC